jgi:hypothetical protein
MNPTNSALLRSRVMAGVRPRWRTESADAVHGLLVALLTLWGVLSVREADAVEWSAPGPNPGITDEPLFVSLRTADNIDIALLDSHGICSARDWRADYAAQVFGYGIRTKMRQMSAEDVARVTAMLLDPGSWKAGSSCCLPSGGVALFVTGPHSDVLVRLDLEAAEANVRNMGAGCACVWGRITPIRDSLIVLVGKYFPDDAEIKRLKVRRADK